MTEWGFTEREIALLFIAALLIAVFFGLATAGWGIFPK